MRVFGLVVLLLVGIVAPCTCGGQVSVYGQFTASNLNGGLGSNYLYGGTAGALYEGFTIRKHVVLSADLQARDVQGGGERLVGITIGPRVSLLIKKLHLSPYGEFMVGFARYRAGTYAGAENTTDNLWEANMGVSKPIGSRLDVVVDYNYSQYGANGGEFNPKSYSAGVIFHLTRRTK